MKGDEAAFALKRNQHQIQGNRFMKTKPRIWKLEFSFIMLLRSQSTNRRIGSSLNEPNPGFWRPSSTTHSWRTCCSSLVP
jgi:hypothetical protein